jgi:hypothetical protein
MTSLAHLCCCFFKQHSISSRGHCARQLFNLVIAATAKETEETALLFLLRWRGRCRCDRGSRAGSSLKSRLYARVEIGNRSLQSIQDGRVVAFGALLLGT